MPHQGYIALITIIIVSAIILLVVVNSVLFSISESDMSLTQEQSSQSFYLAEACAEYALTELQNDINYEGNETLNIGDYSCDILLLEGNGNQDRTIKTQASVNNQTRKIQIDIARIVPQTEIDSWEEAIDL